MEDIEDLVGLGVDVDVPRHRNSVMPRVRRRKRPPATPATEVKGATVTDVSCLIHAPLLQFLISP